MPQPRVLEATCHGTRAQHLTRHPYCTSLRCCVGARGEVNRAGAGREVDARGHRPVASGRHSNAGCRTHVRSNGHVWEGRGSHGQQVRRRCCQRAREGPVQGAVRQKQRSIIFQRRERPIACLASAGGGSGPDCPVRVGAKGQKGAILEQDGAARGACRSSAAGGHRNCPAAHREVASVPWQGTGVCSDAGEAGQPQLSL
mmetsp:Transcript_3022/g.12422  ORF Transcript_3022/g.12422 Transcript_3022/m.12422 type:complete len:200 (-) Transcript_3022:2218-2817(-)